MTEEEALAAALADDLDAHFERLVRVFQDRLYGFALRLTRSPQDAEESTQDTFVRAYRALEKYDIQQRRTLLLKPWLYRIALNVVRNRVRRPGLKVQPIDGEVTAWLTSVWSDQPEALALAAERHRELERLVAELPERYGTAVVLRHVQGLSYAEAAEVLDQPVGTTKSDVHRGLRLLREALDDRRPQLAGLAGGR
jgi:RNA polymerase sigma-70 factor (ECF subfamily)